MFEGVTLPFEVSDLLTAAMGLVKLLGPFVLLGLALVFAPRIIRVIRTSIGGSGRQSN